MFPSIKTPFQVDRLIRERAENRAAVSGVRQEDDGRSRLVHHLSERNLPRGRLQVSVSGR